MSELRVGIVGVGVAGRARVRAARALDGVHLVGAFRGRFIDELGVPSFPSAAALFDACDAVCISSPTPTHAALAKEALERDCHVTVDFPAIDLRTQGVADLRGLYALADRRSLVLHIEHIERLSGVTRCLVERLQHDPAATATLHFSRSRPASSVATLADASIARIHRLSCLLGPVQAVEHVGLTECGLHARLRFPDVSADLHIDEAPDAARELTLQITTHSGRRLTVDGRQVFADGEPIPLGRAAPLFEQDLQQFHHQIQGASPYVPREAVLRILRCAEVIRDGKTGSLGDSW